MNIDGGGDEDNIKGSFASDIVDADTTDTIQTFGGNDFVAGGDSVFGGDGNELLKETQHSASGGSGDDRISQPGQGPFDGGEGNDTLDLNFMERCMAAFPAIVGRRCVWVVWRGCDVPQGQGATPPTVKPVMAAKNVPA